MKPKNHAAYEKARESFREGLNRLQGPGYWGAVVPHIRFQESRESVESQGGRIRIGLKDCTVQVVPLLDPEIWQYLIAQACAHLLLGHVRPSAHPLAWARACVGEACHLVETISPEVVSPRWHEPWTQDLTRDKDTLYEQLIGGTLARDQSSILDSRLLSGPGRVFSDTPRTEKEQRDQKEFLEQVQRRFMSTLREGMADSVWQVSGREDLPSQATKMWSQLINTMPLLSSLSTAFELVEDPVICEAHGIRVGAVSEGARKIYINPRAKLGDEELLFVLAHEMLHVALRHHPRLGWRDPFLWNLACDFVINAWLVEMGYGKPPMGVLLDPRFHGMPAEAIYDALLKDLKWARKLRGWGDAKGDMVGGDVLDGEPATVTWDEFVKRTLIQGWEQWKSTPNRGLMPAGLEEEIRALSNPPPPWDVKLADWFAERFQEDEPRRTWARASRRQASSPDIPRPGRRPEEPSPTKAFGVILDTSGSMPSKVLGKALGAIGSYARIRGVPLVRVVCCDASPEDLGWRSTEELSQNLKIVGRGGTVLTPAIQLLTSVADFPATAPILIVTDGWCESHLSVGRDHAYLVPHGAMLAFEPAGPVFVMES